VAFWHCLLLSELCFDFSLLLIVLEMPMPDRFMRSIVLPPEILGAKAQTDALFPIFRASARANNIQSIADEFAVAFGKWSYLSGCAVPQLGLIKGILPLECVNPGLTGGLQKFVSAISVGAL
jgi:hypothetical protein